MRKGASKSHTARKFQGIGLVSGLVSKPVFVPFCLLNYPEEERQKQQRKIEKGKGIAPWWLGCSYLTSEFNAKT